MSAGGFGVGFGVGRPGRFAWAATEAAACLMSTKVSIPVRSYGGLA